MQQTIVFYFLVQFETQNIIFSHFKTSSAGSHVVKKTQNNQPNKQTKQKTKQNNNNNNNNKKTKKKKEKIALENGKCTFF